ncbi:hypothetical protein WJX72_009239 [[Myrmecia] bisecta]|uniref:Uncharacterized protein n=1 Tax=[Myrmecia] bisecta TaxID=41462 RepID=A0AAW1Q9S7_9CHLO
MAKDLVLSLLAVSSLCLVASAKPTVGFAADGTQFQVETYEGEPRWKLMPFLWTDKVVNVTCPGARDLAVFTAHDMDTLRTQIAEKGSAWCGWQHFIGLDTESCIIRVSPFGTFHVAVQVPPSSRLSLSGPKCTFSVRQQLSPVLLATSLGGVLLFLYAEPLSRSQPFRLSTGTLGFVLLASLILFFMLARNLPSKRSVAVAFAAFGSTFTGLIRYFFGRWIPSWTQLMYSPYMMVYFGISGLIGLAVTYYYDSEENVKLQNILKYGLKLLGLALVGLSSTMPEASAAFACLLIIAQLAGALDVGRGTAGRRPAKNRPSEHAVTPPPSKQLASSPIQPALLVPFASPPSERVPPVPQPDVGWQADAHTPTVPIAKEDLELQDSPLVQQGLVLNLATNRTIQIGKSTYNKLVLEGYQVDRQKGIMTPPKGHRPSTTHGARR